ncbi:MAG: nucleotidyltransferase domain-containing protein [Sphingobium sp.]
MRLRPEEISAIKAAASEAFGPDVVVRLFGSRADDAKRGGDIDLHLEVKALPDMMPRSRFLDLVEASTGGRKVDTVFSVRGTVPSGFEKIAYRDGIPL